MPWLFGDGFDTYAAVTDPAMGGTYWDSGNVSGAFGLVAGRFSGSRALAINSGSVQVWLTKSSGANEAVHHFNVSVQQTTAITGTNIGIYIRLNDGATSQCSVVFSADGSIILKAGDAGATLATYTGAMTAINTWYGFEIEVVINNTTGSFKVRKNGNTSDDFSATGLNTRASANNYANRVSLCHFNAGSPIQVIDDFLWRSDPTSLPWVGDIRCYTRMPASDAAVQWTGAGVTTGLTQSQGSSAGVTFANNVTRPQQYTINYTGTITTITLVTFSLVSGNMKAAIWADNGGVPGAVLASAGPITAVAAGNNVFTLSTPLSVTAGQKIWIGGLGDTTVGNWAYNSTGPFLSGTAAASYATFPQANPVYTPDTRNMASSITYGTAPGNFALVGEPQQDAATTYVASSTVGQADLYGIAPITVTPSSVVAVVSRALAQKTDAGTRNISLDIKSGSTTSAGASSALNTSFGYVWRVDRTDPATGAAWTAVGVNNMQLGPKVQT